MKKFKYALALALLLSVLTLFLKVEQVNAVSAEFDGDIIRLFYPPTGEHLYTLDQNEIKGTSTNYQLIHL